MAPPPTYTINLALPPRERYTHVVADYIDTLRQLPTLFDETITYWKLPVSPCHFLARMFFRRLYSDEQTEELQGISEACGIPLYIFVALNVFIDATMACTSGGVLVQEPGSQEASMLHFRSLDWIKDMLRNAIAQFEFVEQSGGQVIASTLGFVGHVGVLTGVRKGLSVSFNYRPACQDKALAGGERVRYHWNTLMVLMGKRPSVSTLLRECLLPRLVEQRKGGRGGLFKRWMKKAGKSGFTVTEKMPAYGVEDVIRLMPTLHTPVGYIIFCTGAETVILEKGFLGGKVLRSSSFLVAANHDAAIDNPPPTKAAIPHTLPTTEEDTRCNKHLTRRWLAWKEERAREGSEGQSPQDMEKSIQRKKALTKRWLDWKEEQERNESQQASMSLARLLELIQFFPLMNSKTHFLCVMDPHKGAFCWVEKFAEGEVKRKYDTGQPRTLSGSRGDERGD
ncbi:n-acylsphingosine amidohydrolase [Pyrenophora seminiperda CCB06]|uniref:ceramidase n=1 Tax=Pyrenophora seminiperda CCB06 TaxID=1302712 RepID=A0A3M7M1C8_9PLEO|nr:n-acylsphingosine amidohydrolase [Pyrenophora seminiperda CCB06]